MLGILNFSKSYLKYFFAGSVADPGCLSRIQDSGPGFYPSQILDPTKATEEKANKCFFVVPFCSHKYNKAKNYFIFEQVKKKTKIIILLFTQKLSLSSQNYGFWDPGSGKTYP
jgi:hypothetical protein